MKNVKRYGRTGCDDLSGIFVKHSEYAAMEAKCAALAAENLALKESEREFDKMCAEEFGPDWVSEFTETPATDSFLTNVRAQGVDQLLSWLPPYYAARADIEKFAAQIRQEANTAELVAAGIITKVGG